MDRNGYYFIVITVQTEHDFTLSAKVDFNYFYLNASDYDLSNGRYVETVGIPVRQNFDFDNNDIILCFVGSSHSEYRSIHVMLNYNLRIYFVIGISCVISILSILVHVFVFMCWKFVCTKNICNSCIHRNTNTEQHEQLLREVVI